MDGAGPAILAGVLAFLVVIAELITSKYPRTSFLVSRCSSLYLYALIYGLLASGVMLAFQQLVAAGIIKTEGVGLGNRWVQAIVLGVSTKALMHIRLFSVGVGTETFPVGVESFVQLFEPWLLQDVNLYEFGAGRAYLRPYEGKYTDLREVQSKAIANVPATLSEAERVAFEADVGKATAILRVMDMYLHRFGRKIFESIFPL